MPNFRALKISRKEKITGFLKQMRCNALITKITAKQGIPGHYHESPLKSIEAAQK